VGEDLLRRPQLHHLAQVHDADPVGDPPDHREVVGDEEVGQLVALPQVRQQVDDLGLDGDVQGRDGLVADQELRLERQGPGDADPLPLPPGELVGVAAHGVGPHPHHPEKLLHPLLPLGPVAHAVGLQGLRHDLGDPHPRIQAGVGVLKDDLHPPPHPPQGLAPHLRQVLPTEPDPSRRGLEEPQHQPPQGALPAARFPHQGEGLPGSDREGDPIHRPDDPVGPAEHARFHREMLAQVLSLHQGRRKRAEAGGLLPFRRRGPAHALVPSFSSDGAPSRTSRQRT
jgi:hypothetical protein